jgi:hypothetical protein
MSNAECRKTTVNHLTDEDLVLYRYGEAKTPAAIEAHLGACDTCRGRCQALERVLAAVDRFPVPERGETYERDVWARLRPQLATRPRFSVSDWAAFFRPGRLALAGGIAVLVVAAFLAGRLWPRPPQPIPQQAGTRQQVRERVLLVAVGDHLERSQMAILELMNAEPGQTVDISEEQRRARDLVSANRLYRQTAARAGEAAVASLLDDLERVLVEIENSPSMLSASDFDTIRRRIESQGIIFKVRVASSRVRERGQQTRARPPAPTSGL